MYDYDLDVVFFGYGGNQAVPFVENTGVSDSGGGVASEPPVMLDPVFATGGQSPSDPFFFNSQPTSQPADEPIPEAQPEPDALVRHYAEGPWIPTGDWTPDRVTVPQGQTFAQSRTKYRHIDDYWINVRTGQIDPHSPNNSRDETGVDYNSTTGTQLPVVVAQDNWEHIYTAGSWAPISDWSPDPVTVQQGLTFTQGRQSQRHVTDYWINHANGQVRDDNSHTETMNEARHATGTQLPPVAAQDDWEHIYSVGNWTPVSDWSPDTATVTQGQSFTQNRKSERQVTDYWINHLNGQVSGDNSQTQSMSEARHATGTQLPAVVVSLTHHYAEGPWIPTGDWSPDTATVPQGQKFAQSRPKTRHIDDYWIDNHTGAIDPNSPNNSRDETGFDYNSTTGTQLAPVVVSLTHHYAEGPWSAVSDWSPDTFTVPNGTPFTQTRTRQRHIDDFWIDNHTGGIDPGSPNNSHDENSTESRAAFGTQLLPVTLSLTHHYFEGPWTPVDDWAPDTATVPQGRPFTQTRMVSRHVDDFWIDNSTGNMDLTSPNNSHDELSSQSRAAVGTQLPQVGVSLTHHFSEGQWQPVGQWLPDPAAVMQGQTFTQSRPTQRHIDDYWIDNNTGQIDPDSPDNSHYENSSESRPAVGTMVVVAPAENWIHVYAEDAWQPLTEWIPDAEFILQGTQVDQTRSSVRHVTDYWKEKNTAAIRDDNSHNETRFDSRTVMGKLPRPLPVKPTGGVITPPDIPVTAQKQSTSNWWWLLILAALATQDSTKETRRKTLTFANPARKRRTYYRRRPTVMS